MTKLGIVACLILWQSQCPVSWSSGAFAEVRVLICPDDIIRVESRFVNPSALPEEDTPWGPAAYYQKPTPASPSASPSSGDSSSYPQ